MDQDQDIDLRSISKMKDEIKQQFEDRQREWTESYKQKLNALQNEYFQESQILDRLYDNFYKAYEIASHEETKANQMMQYEQNELIYEKQKLQLELKKLQKFQNLSSEIDNQKSENTQQQNLEKRQMFNSKSQTLASLQKKKKASDHYFIKGTNQSIRPQIQSKDIMSEDKILEVQQDSSPQNHEYQFVQTNNQNKSILSNSKSQKLIKSPNEFKSSPQKEQSEAYSQLFDNNKPPVLLSQINKFQPQNFSQELVEEFEKFPKNYSGMIPAFHNESHWKECLEKWNRVGVLHASDIARNAPSSYPIDRNLNVGLNNNQSGFGQIDQQGRLCGVGREVQDFIYEGQFKNNLFHGWGRYIDFQGVYWGLWNNGLRNGLGKWVNSQGQVFEGNWNMGTLK